MEAFGLNPEQQVDETFLPGTKLFKHGSVALGPRTNQRAVKGMVAIWNGSHTLLFKALRENPQLLACACPLLMTSVELQNIEQKRAEGLKRRHQPHPARGPLQCPPEFAHVDLAVLPHTDELLRLYYVLRFLITEKHIEKHLNLEFGNDDAFEVVFYKDVKSSYDALVKPNYLPDNYSGDGPDPTDRNRSATQFGSFTTEDDLVGPDPEIDRWRTIWSLLVNEQLLDHHEQVAGFPRSIRLSLTEKSKFEALLQHAKVHPNQRLFVTCHRALKALRMAEASPAYQHPNAFWHKIDSLCAVMLFRHSYADPHEPSDNDTKWIRLKAEYEQRQQDESVRKSQKLMDALQMPRGIMECATAWTVKRFGRLVFGAILAMIVIFGISIETSRGRDEFTLVVTNNTQRGVKEYFDSLEFAAHSIFDSSINLALGLATYQAGDFRNLSLSDPIASARLYIFLSNTFERNPTMQGLYFGSSRGEYVGHFRSSSGSNANTFWEVVQSSTPNCLRTYNSTSLAPGILPLLGNATYRVPDFSGPAPPCQSFNVTSRPWFRRNTQWTAPYNWDSETLGRNFSSITVSQGFDITSDGSLGVFGIDYSLTDISVLLQRASESMSPVMTFGFLVDGQDSTVASSSSVAKVEPASTSSNAKIATWTQVVKKRYGSFAGSANYFSQALPLVEWDNAGGPYGLKTGMLNFSFGNLVLYGVAVIDFTPEAKDRSFNDAFGVGCLVIGIIATIFLVTTIYLFRLPDKGDDMKLETIHGVCMYGLRCDANCQKFESMDGSIDDVDEKDCGICGHKGAEHIKRTELVMTAEMYRRNRRRTLLSVIFAISLTVASFALAAVALNWYSSTTVIANQAVERLVAARVRSLSLKVSEHLEQAGSVLQAVKFRVESGVFTLPLFGGLYDIGLRATKTEETRNISDYQPIFDMFDPFFVTTLLVLDNGIFFSAFVTFPDDTYMGASKDGETGFTLIGSQDPFNTCYSKYLWNKGKRDVTYRMWQQPSCNFYPTKEKWWKEAAVSNDVVFGYPYFGPRGKLLVTASLALRNALGDPIAVIGVDMDLEGFSELLQTSKLGTFSSARSFVFQNRPGPQKGLMIASSDGAVIRQTPDDTWVMIPSSQFPDDAIREATNFIQIAGFDEEAAETTPVQFRRPLGAPLTSASVLKSQNWVFVILAEWEEFYGHLNREASFMFVVVAGLVLTLVIASVLGYKYLQAFTVVQEAHTKRLDAMATVGVQYGLGMSSEEYSELVKFSREIQIVKGAAVHSWRHLCDLAGKSGHTSCDAPLPLTSLEEYFDQRARDIFRNAKAHRNILTLATMEFRGYDWFFSPKIASNLYLLFTNHWYALFVDLSTAALLLMICFEPATLEDLKVSFPASVFIPTLFLYLILVCDTIMRMVISYGLKGRNSMDPPYALSVDVALCVVLGLSFIDFLVKMTARVSIEYVFPLRPFIALLSSEGILAALISFVVGCYKSRHALLLFAIAVLVSSCIGTQLFRDVPELNSIEPAATTFATFFDAMLTMFIFIGSGENYTDLVYPVLQAQGFLGVKVAFFVVCVMLGMFVIVSFILGEFQTAVTQNRKDRLKFELLEEKSSYIAAFLLLDINRTGIPVNKFASFLVSITPEINEQEVIKIFTKLDKDSDGQINLSEFLDAVEMYLALDPHYSFDNFNRRAEPLRRLIRDRLIYNTENGMSFLDQFALSVLVIQIWIYAGFASVDSSSGSSTEWWLDFGNILCLCLFVLEIYLKIFALGWHGYWKFRVYTEYHGLERTQFAMRLDIIFVVAAVLVTIGTAIVSASKGVDLRSVRLPLSITLLRAFSLVRRVNEILFVVYKVLRHIWDVAMLFMIFFYIWAVYGILLLGRALTVSFDTAARFDTFPNALLVLFQLMVGESWNSVMASSVLATNYYICIFFMSWNLLVSMLLINVFIGILLSSAQALSGRERLSKRDLQRCFLEAD